MALGSISRARPLSGELAETYFNSSYDGWPTAPRWDYCCRLHARVRARFKKVKTKNERENLLSRERSGWLKRRGLRAVQSVVARVALVKLQTATTSSSGSTSCRSMPSMAMSVPEMELGQLPHAP